MFGWFYETDGFILLEILFEMDAYDRLVNDYDDCLWDGFDDFS